MNFEIVVYIINSIIILLLWISVYFVWKYFIKFLLDKRKNEVTVKIIIESLALVEWGITKHQEILRKNGKFVSVVRWEDIKHKIQNISSYIIHDIHIVKK